jgi:hypothetical protein
MPPVQPAIDRRTAGSPRKGGLRLGAPGSKRLHLSNQYRSTRVGLPVLSAATFLLFSQPFWRNKATAAKGGLSIAGEANEPRLFPTGSLPPDRVQGLCPAGLPPAFGPRSSKLEPFYVSDIGWPSPPPGASYGQHSSRGDRSRKRPSPKSFPSEPNGRSHRLGHVESWRANSRAKRRSGRSEER